MAGICTAFLISSTKCCCCGSRTSSPILQSNNSILPAVACSSSSSSSFFGVRFARHWARKAALEKQRRLPNRALRAGSCVAAAPSHSSSSSGDSYAYLGDFSLRRTANGGFCLAPPYPSHSNPTLQQQQQQQMLQQQSSKRGRQQQLQIYRNIEHRDVVSLLPKPCGPGGPWGLETHRIFHLRQRKRISVPIPRHETLNPKP